MKPNQYFASRLVLLLFASIITVNMFAQAGFKEVVERVSPSVVTIYTYDSKGKEIGQGSGFFVRNAGNVVTNRHVIEKAHRAHVNTADGQQFEITHVLAEDKDSDIIVTKISIQPDIAKPARLQTQLPSVGDKIMAFGSPHGYEGSVSDGIISGIRDVEGFGQVFQVTAPVSSGSSGGPLVNLEGEVIGIITFQHIDGQNLNFAIPSQRLALLFSSLVLEESEILSAWSERTQRKDADELYRTGMSFYFANEYSDALHYFERATELNPGNRSAFFYLGYCLIELGYSQNAIRAYSKAIALNPSDAAAYNNRGIAKRNLNDHYGAIADFTKAIELDPSKVLYYSNRGSIKKDKDPYGAISDFTKAIQLDPDDAYYYSRRGLAQYRLNDYYGAIADFTKAIELDPYYPYYYSQRGSAKKNLKDYYGAIADFTKAIELDPNEVFYYSSRGITKSYLNDHYGAIADFTKAIQLDLNDAWNYASRGLAKSMLNDYYGAIADFTKAIELDPMDGAYYYYRSIDKGFLGDFTGACSDLRRAIDLGLEQAIELFKNDCR